MSYIKRIDSRELRPLGEERPGNYWSVLLECGHELAILEDYHSEKVCAHWCPACQAQSELRATLPTILPPRPA